MDNGVYNKFVINAPNNEGGAAPIEDKKKKENEEKSKTDNENLQKPDEDADNENDGDLENEEGFDQLEDKDLEDEGILGKNDLESSML